ncbi:hypothetical protein RGQ29_013847 [Quercus rubra]|uniref:Hexosyltransferase n=1 Tax=Quercus rubra TaxID=3512 RepID=A0AAN7FKD7_QUERU|nr:hypothetical protein RGQ29_013847 [Quercus rubra]
MAPNITATATATTTVVTTKPVSMPSKAYVTFLVAKGLRKVKTKYPLVIAILPDVTENHREILVSQGCIVRKIEPVYPPENQTQFAMANYMSSTTPTYVFGRYFVEYSKMIYLDGDIQVFENIDHLFDLPDNHFYVIGFCQQFPDKVQWPTELGPKPPPYFNAGFFVYEPNLSTYHDLLETLQDFLNLFFKDIYKSIFPVYNLNIEFNKVKVVYYCVVGSKPWRYTSEKENMDREDIKLLVKKWWDIYNDESLDYKNTLASVEVEAGAEKNGLKRFLTTVSEAVVHCINAPSAA